MPAQDALEELRDALYASVRNLGWSDERARASAETALAEVRVYKETDAKSDDQVCPCTDDPVNSPCAVWEDNTSACGCAELGLEGTLPG